MSDVRCAWCVMCDVSDVVKCDVRCECSGEMWCGM